MVAEIQVKMDQNLTTLSYQPGTVRHRLVRRCSRQALTSLYVFHGHNFDISKQSRHIQCPVGWSSPFPRWIFIILSRRKFGKCTQPSTIDGEEHLYYSIPVNGRERSTML